MQKRHLESFRRTAIEGINRIATRATSECCDQGIGQIAASLLELAYCSPDHVGLVDPQAFDMEKRFDDLSDPAGIRRVARFQHPNGFDKYDL